MLRPGSLLFLMLLPFHMALAQQDEKTSKQASLWYLGCGVGLDFSSSPPNPLHIATPAHTLNVGHTFATVTDENGKLIFYTEGEGVYTFQGGFVRELEHGLHALNGTGERQVIVPKPGSASQYYIFYMAYYSDSNNNSKRAVMYATVDMQLNGGFGRVLESNKVLYETQKGSFSISAGCAGKSYWLAGEAKTENAGAIYSFRIDSLGISEKVSSMPVAMTESAGYRFSPDGTKLAFHYTDGTTEATALADFDRTTGQVMNVNVIGACCGYGEFAANGNVLYVNYPKENSSTIVQYDLTKKPLNGITISTVALKGTKLQVARDERIYVLLTDDDKFNHLGTINKPEALGAACDFAVTNNLSPIAGFILTLPEFSTNAFYKSPFSDVDAGEDVEVCIGDKINIGTANPDNQAYQWVPNAFLADPDKGETEFLFDNPISNTQRLKYILKGLGDECVKSDTMMVQINPRPLTPIIGSSSVCPGVTSVSYSTVNDATYSYQWEVEGGAITGSSTTSAIQIDWNETNPAAYVSLVTNNQYNCIADKVTFPVRVNVKLETEIPKGLTVICENRLDGNLYEITNTNGSSYSWNLLNGEIREGQGTHKVKIDWLHSSPREVWVTEVSTTRDTVCFGGSDTLAIQSYVDSLKISIDAVSIHPEDDSKSVLTATISNTPTDFSFPLTVFRRRKDEVSWTSMDELIASNNLYAKFEDSELVTDAEIYEYQWSTINGCQLEVRSDIHHTLKLTATAAEDEDEMQLKWNPYEGWQTDKVRYEVWRKTDNEEVFTLVGTSNNTEIDLPDAGKGFRHTLLVKAISPKSDTIYSWSNTIEVKFKHQLFVPNVFTPNGDSFNETFSIRHLELYPDNELTVYNRYGERVYQATHYNNTWNGEGLSAGTYYYHLRVFNLEEPIVSRGWLQIMR